MESTEKPSFVWDNFELLLSENVLISRIAFPIGLIGVIGNILCVLVLLRKEMKSPSTCLLIGLTSFDLLIGISYLITFGISASYGIIPDKSYYAGQEFMAYYIYPISRTVYTGSVYTTMLISFERFNVIFSPLHGRGNLTRKRAQRSIFGVALFSIVVNFIRWFEQMEISWTDENGEIVNDALLANPSFLFYYEEIFWISIMYVIPFVTIGISNFYIWKEVRRTNANRRTLTTSATQASEISLTKMLLILVLVFFILNMINCTIVIYCIIKIGHKRGDQETLSNVPVLINSSVNFIIYCACGRKFRKELFNVLQEWKRKCGWTNFSNSQTYEHELAVTAVSIIPSIDINSDPR